MNIFLGLVGIVGAFFLIKYRERIGDMVGDPEWARKVGGIYNVLIIIGVLMFFWGVATMTGTSDVFFRPLLMFIPGYRAPGSETSGGVPFEAF